MWISTEQFEFDLEQSTFHVIKFRLMEGGVSEW